jgi:hypothetical protein
LGSGESAMDASFGRRVFRISKHHHRTEAARGKLSSTQFAGQQQPSSCLRVCVCCRRAVSELYGVCGVCVYALLVVRW